MAVSDAKRRANKKYNNKAYDQLMLRVKKGDKEIIVEHAAKHDESLNAFLKRAIYNQLQLDNDADINSESQK